MSDRVGLFRGVVRGGVVVPDAGCELPDGTAVEFGAWGRAGDEAWAMIDAWERGERDAPG